MFSLIFYFNVKMQYSKALRCTFFGERKNSCSSNFVQLFLLNRMKAWWIRKPCSSRFHFINSFISNSFGPNSKTCTCEVRAAWGRVSRGLTVLVVKKTLQNFYQCMLWTSIFLCSASWRFGVRGTLRDPYGYIKPI